MFNQNEKVNTPKGSGIICSRRMAGPDYAKVQSYTILLDTVKEASEKYPFPNPTATVFPANQVWEL